jgi:NodT family efflux transporter outer membrane factor (OMF) lipoprotein
MHRHIVVLAAAIALAGCVPNLGPAPTAKPVTAYATTESFQAPAAAWPQDGWWRRYNDPQLNALIDEALANSPTLAEAQARVRHADALAQQVRAAGLPNLTANAQVGEVRQSYNMGFPPQFIPHGYHDTGQGSLNLNWDLDLFGRNRANLAAATSEAEAAQMDAAQSRLILTTDIVAAYADLARLYAEQEAQAETLANRRSTADLVDQRTRDGVANEGEASQARANATEAEQELANLNEQITIGQHLLAALAGEGPDRGLKLTRPAASTAAEFGLPQNLAVDLLGRRPDVQAARLRAEAAAKRIKAAKAGFYPNINLAAYIGRQALGLDLLREPTSTIGQVAGAMSLPIFDGGRLRGEYRGARADYDAAVAAYDETLIQALQQVADAATSVRELKGRLSLAQAALKDADNAYRIARLRYEAGLTNYLVVLTAENNVILQRRVAADLEARKLSVDAALARALGGGFTAA